MLRCTNCGWFNPDGADFCEMCGESLSSATKVETNPQESYPQPEPPHEHEETPDHVEASKPVMSSTVRSGTPLPHAKVGHMEDFCPMCGYPVQESYKSCPNCRYPLSDLSDDDPVVPESQPEPKPAPTVAEQVPVQPEPEPASAPEPSPTPSLSPKPSPVQGTIREIPHELMEESTPAAVVTPKPSPVKGTVREMPREFLEDSTPAAPAVPEPVPMQPEPEPEPSPTPAKSAFKGTVREIPGSVGSTVMGAPLKDQVYKRTIRELPSEDSLQKETWALIPLTGRDNKPITIAPGEVVEIQGFKYLVKK